MNSCKWLATKQTSWQTKQPYTNTSLHLLWFNEFSCQLIGILYDLNWIVLATLVKRYQIAHMNERMYDGVNSVCKPIFQWNQVLAQYILSSTVDIIELRDKLINEIQLKHDYLTHWYSTHGIWFHRFIWFSLVYICTYAVSYEHVACRLMNRITNIRTVAIENTVRHF